MRYVQLRENIIKPCHVISNNKAFGDKQEQSGQSLHLSHQPSMELVQTNQATGRALIDFG